jgi:hypothetical protein
MKTKNLLQFIPIIGFIFILFHLPNNNNDEYKWYEGSPMGSIFIGILSAVIQGISIFLIILKICNQW